jgi:hypothetical protein
MLAVRDPFYDDGLVTYVTAQNVKGQIGETTN